MSVLDPALVKDLLNHIYEKRKATAFQIEGFTKSALARNDSPTIYKIIAELAELASGHLTLARMGAITALGSVSVALGLFAIAYFLDDIVTPIFATFRDTDARVRYYACESLYNISKIARGEIMLYFNQLFDILCVLVADSESSVKNAADILDRLIKDIVSLKSTNYVSILHQNEGEIALHQTNHDGVALQVNNPQDPLKAFSLPKFVPTLLERMYTINPFSKKFLLSWLELFDDIPSLELVSFLPDFLEPLLRFLMNNCPSDVRIETQNLLNIFLKEVKAINAAKLKLRHQKLVEETAEQLENVTVNDSSLIKSNSTTIIRKADPDFISGQDIFIDYPRIIGILLSFLRTGISRGDAKVNDLGGESHEVFLEILSTVLKWLKEIVEINPTSFTKFVPDCVVINMRNVALTDDNNDQELMAQYLEFNQGLRDYLTKLNRFKDSDKPADEKGLSKEIYDEFVEIYLKRTLQVVTGECLLSVNELARLALLDWLIFLYTHYPSSFFSDESFPDGYLFDLTALLRSTSEASNELISKVLQLAAQISESNQDFFKEFIINLILFFETDSEDSKLTKPQPALTRAKVEFIIRQLCVSISAEKIFETLSEVLVNFEQSNLDFISNIVVTLNMILLTTPELLSLRKKLRNLDFHKVDDWGLFSKLFQSWCHNAPSALSLCLLTSNYELAFLIIKHLGEAEVTLQLLTQLDVLVQLLESPIFLKLRLQLLEPEKHPHLFKTLYGILMIMPQSSTYTTLKNRLSTLTLMHQTAAPTLTTPAGTPLIPGVATNSTTLSAKRKRTHELADIFVKVQDSHEHFKGLREDHSEQSSQVPSTRVPTLESPRPAKDYFSAFAKPEKRR